MTPNRPATRTRLDAVGSGRWLGLLCLVLLLACSSGDRQESPITEVPQQGGELRVLCEPPGSLDPIAVDEVYESAVVRQIFEGLVLIDPDFRLLPGIASSWQISPDETSYTFHLRPDLRFHDGRRLTAPDVAYSFQRCLDPNDSVDCLAASYLIRIRGSRAYLSGRTNTVEGIRVLGDRTLRIELEEPIADFLYILAMDQTCIVPRGFVEENGPDGFNTCPIGSGPFRFVRRNKDDGVTLARFDGYWGQKPYIDSLTYQPIPESEGVTETEALLSGRIDLATLDMGDGPVARQAGLPVFRSPELSVSFLAMQLGQPPLDIPGVRRAVMRAIDRDRIRAIDPEGMVPAHGLLPPGMPGRHPGDHMPAYDLQEASRLLAECGHPHGSGLPPLRIATSDAGRAMQMCNIIRRDLEEVGFAVQIETMEWRSLDSLAMAGALPIFLMSWVADLPDATSYLRSLFHSQGPSNLFGYASPVVDSLLDQLSLMPSGPEKIEALLTVQDAILGDAPIVPLFHSSLAYAWRPEVRGLRIGPSGLAMIDMCQVWFQHSLASTDDGAK